MSEQVNLLTTKEIFGKQFNIYGTILEPLFLAKDVAELIDYSKRSDGSYQVGQMIKSVDEDEKICTVNNVNGGREMWFLTENGLYEVLMQSRKPIAKEFKKQVKAILKEIRLYGGYIPGNTPDEINQNTLEINENKIKDLDDKSLTLNNMITDLADNSYNMDRKINSLIDQVSQELYIPIERDYVIDDVIEHVDKQITLEDVKKAVELLRWVIYDSTYVTFDTLRIITYYPYMRFTQRGFNELVDYINRSRKVLYY